MEKAGKYADALAAYQQALEADETQTRLYKNIGFCQARLGLWNEASASFDSYLEEHPGDSTVKAYNERVKATLLKRRAAELDVEDPFSRKPPPKKYVKLQFELLTPQIVGADISYYVTRNHNLGLGFFGFGQNSGYGKSSISVLHPRWRYYNARWYWDSFYELGGTFATLRTDYGGGYYYYGADEYIEQKMTTADFAIGANYTRNFWTIEFMLSFMFGTIGQKSHMWTTATYTGSGYTYTYRDYEYSSPFGLILPGVAMGLVF